MMLTLELEPEIESTAMTQAAADGVPLAEYVESVVRESILRREKVRALSKTPFDEILEPFRIEIASSGMTDDELDALFEHARTEAAEIRRGE